MQSRNARLVVVACLFLSACTADTPYRTQFLKNEPCPMPAGTTNTAECAQRSWQRVGDAYDVLFVEFDDMGLLHPKGGKNVGDAWDHIENTMQTLITMAQQ